MASRTLLVLAAATLVVAGLQVTRAANVPVKATPAASSPSKSQTDSLPPESKLPLDVLCSVYGTSKECASTPQQQKTPVGTASVPKRPKRQIDSAGGGGGGDLTANDAGAAADPAAPVDPALICSVFGGPTCPLDQTKTFEGCPCPRGDCQCLPFYQCDNTTGEFNKFGVGLLDIRGKNGSCPHYLHDCCKVREGGLLPPPNNGSPEPNPNPDPIPDPAPDRAPDREPRPVPEDPGNGGQDTSPLSNGRKRCGMRNRDGIGRRILHNFEGETQFGEFPWMVAIFRGTGDLREYICGGGLIAPTVVLTAAHCVFDKEPQTLTIRAGEWDSRTEDETYKHQDRDVEQVISHPAFKDRALHNDVALLVLREPVVLGYHVGTVCLPDEDQVFEGKLCTVTGWGKAKFEDENQYQVILKKIDLPVVPHGNCQDMLRRTRVGPYFRLDRSFMCAGGEKGRDSCKGDGGSPLVCPVSSEDDARYQFAGTVAWGIGCGEDQVPAAYGNVALFRRWIDEQVSNLNIDPSIYRISG